MNKEWKINLALAAMSKQFRHGAPLIARHHTNMAGRSPKTSLNDGAGGSVSEPRLQTARSQA